MKRLLSLLALSTVALVAAANNDDRTKSSMGIDDKFAKEALACGQFEVQVSTLATKRATNPEIKKLAQKMVEDHTKMNTELASITQKRRSTSETALNPVHSAMLAELSKESGEDFDECYLKMQVLGHEGALMCYRKEAKRGQDPQLKAFAERSLPKLREHLHMARKVCEHSHDDAHETLKPKDNKDHDK